MTIEEYNHIVNFHKGEDHFPLKINPNLNYLLDFNWCNSITKKLESYPNRSWIKSDAFPNLWESLPNSRGVYLFVWKPTISFKFESKEKAKFCWPIYIGRAGSKDSTKDTLRERYKSDYAPHIGKHPDKFWTELNPKNRDERLAIILSLRPLEYWYLHLDDLNEIQLIEKHLYEAFKPPLNRIGPSLKIVSSEPAFGAP